MVSFLRNVLVPVFQNFTAMQICVNRVAMIQQDRLDKTPQVIPD